MRIGMAADYGGFALKEQLTAALKSAGYALSWDLVQTVTRVPAPPPLPDGA